MKKKNRNDKGRKEDKEDKKRIIREKGRGRKGEWVSEFHRLYNILLV